MHDPKMVEMVARAIYERPEFFGNDPKKTPWVERGNSFAQDDTRALARAALDALAAAGRLVPEGCVAVERKLLTEAHACMRETGWHLAMGASRLGSDGVLEAACSDVEARMRAMLAAALRARLAGEEGK